MFCYDTIWDDTKPDQIASIPSTQLHRNVDSEVEAADTQGITFLSAYSLF